MLYGAPGRFGVVTLLSRLSAAGRLPEKPGWLEDGVVYLTATGSVSYGCSTDESDADVVGVCVPPKRYLWPKGEIQGFSTPGPRFDVWQRHHVDTTGQWGDRKSADFAIYSIAKFCRLAMDNNPNAVDILFAPEDCILVSSQAWGVIRDSRRIFLHKGSYHKFRGYAHSQLAKIRTKDDLGNIDKIGNRRAIIERYGYDTKFAYHVVRLALECEQILVGGDLDLRRDREMYKAVRRGEWTLDELKAWWARYEPHLDGLYRSSQLPHSADEGAIKDLLVRAISCHYGTVPEEASDDTKRIARQREALAKIGALAEIALQ